MAGGVDEGETAVGGVQPGLFGEDGNAPGPLQVVGVQKGVPVIHPAQSSAGTAAIEQGFGQGGFSGVHMGQQTGADMRFFRLFAHGRCPFHCISVHYYSMKCAFRR